jgi:hypothetical protein
MLKLFKRAKKFKNSQKAKKNRRVDGIWQAPLGAGSSVRADDGHFGPQIMSTADKFKQNMEGALGDALKLCRNRELWASNWPNVLLAHLSVWVWAGPELERKNILMHACSSLQPSLVEFLPP